MERFYYMYNKLANEIEDAYSQSPNDFWNFVKKLGPRKKSQIPMKVYGTKGEAFITNEEEVDLLDKWKEDLAKLYNVPVEDFELSDNFKNFTVNEKHQHEEQLEDATPYCK